MWAPTEQTCADCGDTRWAQVLGDLTLTKETRCLNGSCETALSEARSNYQVGVRDTPPL